MTRCSPRTVRSGFSLVELLVVLAVMLVLLAILMPVYHSMRQASMKVRCVSHLRQIYTAMLAFTEDHDGRLPPTLGPAPGVHPSYTINQYWWGQAYLGRYAIGPLNRPRHSNGRFSQEEVAIYNCPARFADGPDLPQNNGNPSISYTMVAFYGKNATNVPNSRSIFRTMENKARTLLITEGRGMSLYQVNTITRPLGSSGGGLRRFHQGSLNLLFLDGHLESFSGPDEELVRLHPQ